MRVVIAGGHGRIALRLAALLTARGDEPVGLVRNPAHLPDLAAVGAQGVVCDLEAVGTEDVVAAVTGADAVVFAAGAGPGSGAERKDSMDRGGAALLADAAERAGVTRYLLVSSLGAGDPDAHAGRADDVFLAYLRAKAASETDLRGREGLDWTVLRPGGLTDEPGTGRVRLEPSVEPGRGSRDDVAAVLLALLDEPSTAGLTLELVAGDDVVDAAVQAAGRQEPGDASTTALREL